MNAAALIREARRRGGLSQAELARRLGTKQPVIARWERGLQAPSYDNVRRAARACGWDLGCGLRRFDRGEEALLSEWLRLTPLERLARNGALLATEAWARRARPISRRDRDARR